MYGILHCRIFYYSILFFPFYYLLLLLCLIDKGKFITGIRESIGCLYAGFSATHDFRNPFEVLGSIPTDGGGLCMDGLLVYVNVLTKVYTFVDMCF